MRAILKKLISSKNKDKILSTLEKIDKKLIPLFAKNGFLASLYYTFFNHKFYREQQSVLQGRIRYWQHVKSPQASSTMLRRNIHRLEKGLIMQPQRATFATAYIEETVAQYQQCIAKDTLLNDERQWAQDVLSKYFQTVTDNETIAQARSLFEGNNHNNETPSAIPYNKENAAKSLLSYDEIALLCRQRRSVRWYQDKLVEMDKIKQALQVATQAPSACNRQPFSFYVFNEPKDAQKIGKIPMGTVGFSDNFQCTIVVVGELSAYPNERDRHIIYIDASLAVMQFMLALETLGLSSCVINWPDVEYCEKAMTKALKLNYEQRPVMLISVGYAQPQGKIPFSQKKSPETLIKEIQL